MPKYAKFMKDILSKKEKGSEASKIILNEQCSAVILNKVPHKEKDPGGFTIPCVIGKSGITKALADLGASISLIPYSMFLRLNLRDIKPTRMCIELEIEPLIFQKGLQKTSWLEGNEYYCFLDAFFAYFQIPLALEGHEKTTFTCPYGTFAYRRMPFELCNDPATFQRCMTKIFHDMCKDFMEVLMDDFSLLGNSFGTCLNNLSKMLARCEEMNLVLNWEKCHFMVKEGIVLGHKISKAGIEVYKAKVDVIASLPYPINVIGTSIRRIQDLLYTKLLEDIKRGPYSKKAQYAVKMEDPNITIEEYIRLKEEKARRRGKMYNWETATYGKIWDNEDVHGLGCVETEFPAIVFNDMLTSEAVLSCEPTVSSLNNAEIDFRILFDESDDEDYM
ncbi:reverse transcriptase domain-containing protein, partial [Tanacetum coccineum]